MVYSPHPHPLLFGVPVTEAEDLEEEVTALGLQEEIQLVLVVLVVEQEEAADLDWLHQSP